MTATPEQLDTLKAGDRVLVQDGVRTWWNNVVRVTAKMVYTDGRNYFKSSGVAKMRSYFPPRIVGVEVK